ncbi:ABC transporter permease [Leuconostocaceae bacterium ESL0723]|nr:ABC transporter permease [Leuconostocaceae bacterium ESL0723]
MITLLKQEYMKLWKQDRGYYYLAFAFVLPFVMFWLDQSVNQIADLGGGVSFANVLMSILAAVIITQEFALGTIRPLLSRRFSRGMIFTAKVLTVLTVFFVIALVSLLASMIAVPIFVHHWQNLNWGNIIQLFLINFWGNFGENLFAAALIIMVANIAKSSSVAIVFVVLMTIGLAILDALSDYLIKIWSPLKWNPISVFNVFGTMVNPDYRVSNWSSVTEKALGASPLVLGLVYSLYVVLMYLIAYAIFRRRSV